MNSTIKITSYDTMQQFPLTFSQRLLTSKVKNYIAGLGALCILGAVGQGINMIDGEDVSIVSILIFLVVGVALVWFSKFKK